MEILVDVVRIAGFRGVKELEVNLSPVTVLIGMNNSGKTSVIKALQLSLGDYARLLTEEDFHISKDQTRATEIKVDSRIVPIDATGARAKVFPAAWMEHFGDSIQSEADGSQFVALRSNSRPNLIKGGFETNRFSLDKWPEYTDWQTASVKETRLGNKRFNLSLIPIDAQRDIHNELKDKYSFVGKILSSVSYEKADIDSMEKIIALANNEAVSKSEELKNLKAHLESLSASFQGAGSAEITPFPKKIRDLSKHFSIQFGEDSSNSFSMEYHGMGTRSWASMLTVKSFLEMTANKHKEEEEPFFPILAAEEPEAHLHPNAQKTLYHQLASSEGQVVVSTHSPYLAAMAEQSYIRYLRKRQDDIFVGQLANGLDPEDKRRLQREVMHSRGEIIFSKALVLCEGETEEQALPLLFKKYFNFDPFVLGVSFIGVGGSGKKYLPFLSFARDFSIPLFIFSDGEAEAVRGLTKVYSGVYGATDVTHCDNITILDGTDFEGYLLSSGHRELVVSVITDLDGVDAVDRWIEKRNGTSSGRAKTNQPPCKSCGQPIFIDIIRDYKKAGGEDIAICEILDSSKPRFAPAIAEKLCTLDPAHLPPKIIELFENIKKGAGL
jgi:putative ATP-dependent endonuclease of OLD family